MPTHYLNQNQSYWDQQAAQDSPWSQPVSDELVLNAKNGNWDVHLMPSAIDKNWLGDIQGKKILCLASAGGQQAPILAAAGAIVTVLDISEGQLKKDQDIADKHQLTLTTVQGNMNDLSQFEDGSFDLVFHPISNLYVPDVNPVWKECFRVLKTNGRLLASFYNPIVFVDDRDALLRQKGLLKPTYEIPFSDIRDLPKDLLQQKIDKGESLVFGHSLTDLIGGQTKAGFLIKDFIEEFAPRARFLIDDYLPTFIATYAIKLD